jgi:hypothetical protein
VQQGDMDDTKGLFGGTMHRMNSMMQAGGWKNSCYIALALFVLFFLLYWAMSRKSTR